MAPIDRRRLLALAAGLGTALAGCLGGGPSDGGGSDDDDGSTPTETPTETPGDGTDTPAEAPAEPLLVDADVIQYATRASAPDWYEDGTAGNLTVIGSRDCVDAALDIDAVAEDRREIVRTFVDETDFDRSLLLLVESVGPDTCHTEVEVSNLAVEDGRLRADAAAVDTSGSDQMCGQAITFPSALVRADFEGPLPERASVRITDGWGDTTEIAASTGRADPCDVGGYVRPDGDPVVRDPLTCDREGFDRHPNWVDEEDLTWGTATDEDGDPVFALRVDTLTAAYGDEIRVALTNVTDEEQGTGNRHKYNVQTYTEDGWQDVRGVLDGDPIPYTDEGVVHGPGEGFEWTLELTEEGLVADHYHADRLVVCPDLEPGRYRFVFWEPAVAVAFDLAE